MDILHRIIGSSAHTILWWQMVCRGVLIFLYTLFLVRFGGRRIFGKSTSFDIVLGVILGSIMSRALTANARFIPTLAAATALVLLHWLFATIALHNKTFSQLIKGDDLLLVEDGRIKEEALRRANLTESDLKEALRANGGTCDVERVKAAYLERSGEISVISR